MLIREIWISKTSNFQKIWEAWFERPEILNLRLDVLQFACISSIRSDIEAIETQSTQPIAYKL